MNVQEPLDYTHHRQSKNWSLFYDGQKTDDQMHDLWERNNFAMLRWTTDRTDRRTMAWIQTHSMTWDTAMAALLRADWIGSTTAATELEAWNLGNDRNKQRGCYCRGYQHRMTAGKHFMEHMLYEIDMQRDAFIDLTGSDLESEIDEPDVRA